MARWEPDAAGRLAQAAMDLYGEQGFEQTTVAQIAQRAGLTERTFFRHFADKREVLFAGSAALEEQLVAAIGGSDESAAPLDAVAAGVRAISSLLEDTRGREFVRRRHAVVTANAELRERELIKMATLAGAITAALRERGVAEPTATLAAQLGIAVFRTAFERWVTGSDEAAFGDLVDEALDELRAVATA